MNMMVSELYDALLSAGADEAKARRAAEGFADSDQQFKLQFAALREDNQRMRTETASLRGELVNSMTTLDGSIRREMQSLRAELSLIKWMAGVVVGMLIAVLLKVYFA